MIPHFYKSLGAGLAAMLLCGALFLTPIGWWTFAISLGTVVFVVVLWLNPDRRYFRLGVATIGSAIPFGISLPAFKLQIRDNILFESLPDNSQTVVTITMLVLGAFFVLLDYFNKRYPDTPPERDPTETNDPHLDPPHRVFVWLFGRWYFSRWVERTSFNEAGAMGRRWNPVNVPLSEIHPLHSMPDISSKERCLIIHGPAGIGKSVHASLLALKFAAKHNIQNTGLFLRVSRENHRDHFENAWELACVALRAVDYPIPRLAVAYALSRRPLLILIEDAHFLGAVAEQSLRKLRATLRAERSEMSTCSILVTTRSDRQTIDNADYCELSPLSPRDSLNLLQNFIDDSKSRKVIAMPPVNDIAIFTNSETRTPLFIGLAAAIIRDQPERMPDVLKFQATKLIDEYIQFLYRTSSFKSDIREDVIYNNLKRLAYEVWPHSQVSPSNVVAMSAPSLEELEKNGFLVKPSAIAKSFQFPHISIAHRLAVGLMSELGNFSKFHNLPAEFLQSLMAFVELEIQSESKFLSLAKSTFDLSVQIYGRLAIVLTSEGMTNFVEIAAQETEVARSKLTDWESFFSIVYNRSNTEELLSIFCRRVRRTANGVSALCHMRSKESKLLLEEWLCRDDSVDEVRAAAFNDPEVEIQLLALLEEQQVLSTIAVSIVAILAARVSNRERLVHWLRDHGRKPTKSWSRMIQIGSDSDKVLVLAACDWDEELRRNVVAILCRIREHDSDIMIPSGAYTVRVLSGEKKIFITAPYILRRKPVKRFYGTFQRESMRKKIPNGDSPPSRSQLLVAHELSESLSKKGYITFHKDAFEIVDNGRPGFIGFSSDGRVNDAHPTESTKTIIVCYRTARTLELKVE